MSRAFNPPDTLSKDEIRTIADVRREIWTNGFRGLAIGSIVGWSSHFLVRAASKRYASVRNLMGGASLGRNTAFLSFMGGGALCSFAFATAAGRNNVHHLHPVIENNKKSGSINQGSMYQIMVARAKREEKEKEKQCLLEAKEKRRLQRRRTMTDRWGETINNVESNTNDINSNSNSESNDGSRWSSSTIFSPGDGVR